MSFRGGRSGGAYLPQCVLRDCLVDISGQHRLPKDSRPHPCALMAGDPFAAQFIPDRNRERRAVPAAHDLHENVAGFAGGIHTLLVGHKIIMHFPP